MIFNQRMRRIYGLALVAVTTVVIGHGCGQIGEVSKNSESSSSVAFDAPVDFDPIANTRTVSTVYAKNVLDNYVSCTGIGVESPSTKAVWDSRKGSLSDFGFATHISAPMMMAIASVAGEVCNDLITIEKSLPSNQRNIFNSFDLSATPSRMPAAADIGDASARVALSCWQRNIDTEERVLIENDVSATSAGAALSSKEVYNAALMVCTSMLASLSAIEM